MAFFNWQEDYSVGIAQVDAQHKQLVAALNDLYSAMKEGKGNEKVAQVLTDLVEYTKNHFATEENLMRLYKFPGYEEHQKKHKAMALHVTGLYEKFKSEKRFNTLEIANYLKDWLNKHIMGTDKSYQVFLNDKGVR